MMTDERGQDRSGHKPAGGGQPHVTVTTTTTTSPTYSLDWIKFDVDYFRTLPGFIKLIELVLGILCMALGAPAIPYYGGTNFFLFVVVMAFILTFIWVIVFLLTVRETLQFRVPWVDLEFYYTAGTTVFYAIAMIVEFASAAAMNFYGRSYYQAAAAFALFNTLLYAFGTFLLYKDWSQSRTSSTTTTTTTANVA